MKIEDEQLQPFNSLQVALAEMVWKILLHVLHLFYFSNTL